MVLPNLATARHGYCGIPCRLVPLAVEHSRDHRLVSVPPQSRYSAGHACCTRLLELLAPKPGETILELGPGTGYYTLPVARQLYG